MNTIETLINQLPAQLHNDIGRIADTTIKLQTLLRVCVVGEFSAGKSSLINMLLGEALLPTAREETTALPTFIEYAPALGFALVNTDKTSTVLTQVEFASYTVTAPEQALCSVLNYPAPWLNGLSLIDLPGLGSQSQRHSDYTTAQISTADAIIYLLSPRGATQDDLATLRVIKNYGKQVIIAVSQWDTIEQSIQDGEHAPDLSQWQAQIAEQTGLDLPLLGVSKYGQGRDAVIAFLRQTQTDLQAIREHRFYAECVPLLTNALGQLTAEQTVCASKSVEETQSLHSELISQKQNLLNLKADCYERCNQDQSQLEQKAQQWIGTHREQLDGQMQAMPPVTHYEDWPMLTELAQRLLQERIALTAQALTALSTQYGQLDLPEIDIQQFNLRLPPPEPIELNHFIDNSRLLALQTELAQKQRAAEAAEAKINALPEVSLDASLQQLSALRIERETLAQQELPRIQQTIAGNNDGSQMGRTIGQLLDIGLIVFEAPLAVVKGAALLGESARVAKVVGEAAKVAQKITSPELKPVLGQLGFLEKLSLSYWGEQIGKRFDQPEQNIAVIDPQAAAQQQRLLQEHDQQIAIHRAELHRLETLQQERDYTGWALEQHLKEQQRIKNSIQLLQEKAKAAQREAEADQLLQQHALLETYRRQIINQSLLHFDQQTRPMADLLRKNCKRYWQEHIETTLAQRLQAVDALSQQLQQAPEQKQAALAALQQQILQIQTVLGTLKAYNVH